MTQEEKSEAAKKFKEELQKIRSNPRGYHIFVDGLESSGKNEAIRKIREYLDGEKHNPVKDEENDRRHEAFKNQEQSQAGDKENNNEFPMVKVVWEDASSSMDSISVKDMKELETLAVVSVGELIVKDEEKVVLSFMSCEDNVMRHWQVIPKSSVYDIIYLKEAD